MIGEPIASVVWLCPMRARGVRSGKSINVSQLLHSGRITGREVEGDRPASGIGATINYREPAPEGQELVGEFPSSPLPRHGREPLLLRYDLCKSNGTLLHTAGALVLELSATGSSP
jgi:hypothetical protein